MTDNPTLARAKTYKRELSIALLFVLGGVGYMALENDQAMMIFDKLRWPVFTVVAAAFGLDAVAKQWGAR